MGMRADVLGSTSTTMDIDHHAEAAGDLDVGLSENL